MILFYWSICVFQKEPQYVSCYGLQQHLTDAGCYDLWPQGHGCCHGVTEGSSAHLPEVKLEKHMSIFYLCIDNRNEQISPFVSHPCVYVIFHAFVENVWASHPHFSCGFAHKLHFCNYVFVSLIWVSSKTDVSA